MPTVLIVEDDDLNRTLFQEFLKRIGYSVASAARAEEGVELALAVQPVLVLMDLHLPGGMDGLEAARVIKAMPNLAAVPVIIISADYSPGIEQRVLDAGCAGFLRKPIEMSRLRQIVQGLVKES